MAAARLPQLSSWGLRASIGTVIRMMSPGQVHPPSTWVGTAQGRVKEVEATATGKTGRVHCAGVRPLRIRSLGFAQLRPPHRQQAFVGAVTRPRTDAGL